MPGIIWSRYSTTVTSAPKRLHTEPNSSPITPPPMTRSFSGTFLSSKAPVDDTICFSSISRPGSVATSDPVAMTIFFVFSFFPSTSTVLASMILPNPLICSTLFFLNKNSIPDVRPETVFSFAPIMALRSKLTSPVRPMPAKLF